LRTSGVTRPATTSLSPAIFKGEKRGQRLSEDQERVRLVDSCRVYDPDFLKCQSTVLQPRNPLASVHIGGDNSENGLLLPSASNWTHVPMDHSPKARNSFSTQHPEHAGDAVSLKEGFTWKSWHQVRVTSWSHRPCHRASQAWPGIERGGRQELCVCVRVHVRVCAHELCVCVKCAHELCECVCAWTERELCAELC
jgi:hypothetical protein